MLENVNEFLKVNFPGPITQLLRVLDYQPVEKSVLDCGAGGGRPPLALFKLRGYLTTGIDINKGSIQLANEFVKKHNLNLNISEGDMRKIPFENNTFGCVFSYNTIFHMNKRVAP